MILIKHNKNWGLSEDLVSGLAKKALQKRGLNEKEVELSICFVGPKKAKELNIKYRQMSYIPQVLGFPMSKVKDSDGMIRMGDIVICNSKLKYEAKFQHKSIDDILEFWLLHGVDNLL